MTQTEKIDKMYDICIKIEPMIKDYYGNGREGTKIEVDRLNLFRKFSLWFYALIAVTHLGLVARLVHDILSK